MPIYISDTHALPWYLGDSPILGTEARSAFEETLSGSSQINIPAIVLAEIILLVEKRRINTDISKILSTLRDIPGFNFSTLSPEVVLRIHDMKSLPDIHDRLIVAEAIITGAKIITFDKTVTSSGMAEVVW